MIPAHNQSGVLPPFIPGALPSDAGAMAPYKSSLMEVIARFAITPERVKILRGFIEYREFLKANGITHGVQWIDGSFVEQAEINLNRAPNDIDVVTYCYRPQQYLDNDKWGKFMASNPHIIDTPKLKSKYCCDAYLVDLQTHPMFLMQQTQYWFGLFSHQRESYLWKGLIEISLEEDDLGGKRLLSELEKNVI